MACSLEFTAASREALEKALSNPQISYQGAEELILRELEAHHRPIPFCDYLRRYIIRKTGIPTDASVDECAAIMRSSFREYGVPTSFSSSTIRLATFVRNCLTQRTISRENVFLLAFGLRMTPDDVNELLTHALHEEEIYFKNTFEAICWYCYAYGYGYSKYRQMTECLDQMERTSLHSLFDEDTGELRRYLTSKASAEEKFLTALTRLKEHDGTLTLHNSIRIEYAALYREVQEIIRADKLTKSSGHTAPPTEITPTDIEKALYPSVPRDSFGNLLPEKASALSVFFTGVRLTRHRLGKLNTNLTDITRYDLLTLCFYVFSCEAEKPLLAEDRTSSFGKAANAVLRRAGLWNIYPAHPYEAFLLLCAANEKPFEVFSKVMGDSYPLSKR